MRWSERKDKRGKRVTNTEREGEGQKEIKSTRRILLIGVSHEIINLQAKGRPGGFTK